MNNSAVIIIALFAVVAVAAFLVFRQRGRVNIRGPFGAELDLDASNEPVPPPPDVSVTDATSSEGGLLAEATTGGRVVVERVEVKDDIIASSSPPPNTGPKAEPPA